MTKDEFIQLLDTYKLSCDVVGYDSGQVDSLKDKAYHTSNPDDKQAYESAIERMNTTIEYNREVRDEIRTKLIDSFKGGEIGDSK
ncbi:hypothetical protein [Companilactobacillus kimchii]|uniref:Uncharacterized protein n=2 Tax=Companilactobacillus kimchii TaxID=2801452 RepID=A0ABR5NQR5_9LACO|nr:hypothetical protein [Companilactobacillus kimchii]KAE9562960.1 hypothetical protein ATN91_02005 [Companilactobacillus kimchii]KRK49997.1 hypothetical protein FC97_GL002384 [Companilactobacillus kimchii DSM 13961 = JCM 10707]OWF31954.1 hypothetical protein LKACC12383_02568 [Companilactobacillus kimchii]GEO48400.1 hypothetical protein LKI01_23990 [Companilactobacillus paralimentarius]